MVFLDKFHMKVIVGGAGKLGGVVEEGPIIARSHALPAHFTLTTLLPRAPRMPASLGTLTVQYGPIINPSHKTP